ncbi:hypothetical protein PAT3040_05648 [Paenibacillus agaridevorans]|uniref:Uncharacterized protein n=1 Tax=Paenibacillus agaridevorans TaxID=171404 RepID=A0A2R5F0K5_9BACL|nr:hypothetical protein PAT3040_05648 [Paenibacillus agaridevorans]
MSKQVEQPVPEDIDLEAVTESSKKLYPVVPSAPDVMKLKALKKSRYGNKFRCSGAKNHYYSSVFLLLNIYQVMQESLSIFLIVK